ncbi:MAG: hypothetical protein WC712_03460 [Candidatus Brocadiia bacterium]
MKTKLAAAAILLALLSVSVSCGGPDNSGFPAKVTAPDAIELTFMPPYEAVVSREISLYRADNSYVYGEVFTLHIEGKASHYTLNYPLTDGYHYVVYYRDNFKDYSGNWWQSATLEPIVP